MRQRRDKEIHRKMPVKNVKSNNSTYGKFPAKITNLCTERIRV